MQLVVIWLLQVTQQGPSALCSSQGAYIYKRPGSSYVFPNASNAQNRKPRSHNTVFKCALTRCCTPHIPSKTRLNQFFHVLKLRLSNTWCRLTSFLRRINQEFYKNGNGDLSTDGYKGCLCAQTTEVYGSVETRRQCFSKTSQTKGKATFI